MGIILKSWFKGVETQQDITSLIEEKLNEEKVSGRIDITNGAAMNAWFDMICKVFRTATGANKVVMVIDANATHLEYTSDEKDEDKYSTKFVLKYFMDGIECCVDVTMQVATGVIEMKDLLSTPEEITAWLEGFPKGFLTTCNAKWACLMVFKDGEVVNKFYAKKEEKTFAPN